MQLSHTHTHTHSNQISQPSIFDSVALECTNYAIYFFIMNKECIFCARKNIEFPWHNLLWTHLYMQIRMTEMPFTS